MIQGRWLETSVVKRVSNISLSAESNFWRDGVLSIWTYAVAWGLRVCFQKNPTV